ncbi:hypothetical protein BS78_05G197700 [Paspalum vaginatum]|nr:hypothetical protein BS78_05G197700 [Paspalum vaginatum]
MALKCALDLRIPDAIQRYGGATTIDDLLVASDLPPSSLPYLRRLMRVLTALHIFALRRDDQDPAADDAAAAAYQLTATSRLLLSGGGGSPFSLLPSILSLVQQPIMSMLTMGDWMMKHHDASAATSSLFEMAHGKSMWESMQADAEVRARFYDSMDADSRLVMHAVLSDSPAVFHDLASLVDVGGGHVTASAAVARAFPHIKCTVMDLPHVVAEAPPRTGLSFVAGDMFDHIRTADALLLKWILQDWDDAKCIKIMQRCKEAISRNDNKGFGKVIIIDAAIG